MPASRPSSRPVSRSNSISEAPISLPVDPRVAHLGAEQHSHHRHGEHHNTQDPKLFGPGFSSAAPHSAVEAQVRYVLVTPEMLQAIESGTAPHTNLVHPAGTDLRAPTPSHGFRASGADAHLPTLTKEGTRHAISTSSSGGEKGEALHNEVDTLDVAPYDPTEPQNPWARLRRRFKEPFGEFIGTMILIIFGNGVNCQVVLSRLTQGSYLSISFGWGIGVMFGVYAAGGISGAHLNPAVTICLAVWRGFPWRKVPGYAIGQLAGAFLGSILIQSNYYNLINEYEGGAGIRTFGGANSTGALFFTATQPYMTNVSAFFSEFFATAVLLGLILALGDANNNPAPAGMNGMILLWLIVGIGAALGTQTAYCLNPARDLGPRIAAACFGYGKEIWTYRNGYFAYVAIVAPICGAVFGGFFYDLFIFSGPESPLNRPWGKKKQQQIEA